MREKGGRGERETGGGDKDEKWGWRNGERESQREMRTEREIEEIEWWEGKKERE
jgi:hypothetical protein